jgi:hypothetical protein
MFLLQKFFRSPGPAKSLLSDMSTFAFPLSFEQRHFEVVSLRGVKLGRGRGG